MESGQHLLGIETSSASFAFKLLNEILQNDWLETVEVSSGATGKNFLLFKSANFANLQKLKLRIEEKYGSSRRTFGHFTEMGLLDQCLIENIDPILLSTLISLEHNPVEESVVIVETPGLCGVIEAIQLSIKQFSLKVCDLRLMRAQGGVNHVFLTGSEAACTQVVGKLSQDFLASYRQANVSLIDKPHPRLKEYFSLGF